eukprot:7816848-Alexandrium_andersonii.AAC.1
MSRDAAGGTGRARGAPRGSWRAACSRPAPPTPRPTALGTLLQRLWPPCPPMGRGRLLRTRAAAPTLEAP